MRNEDLKVTSILPERFKKGGQHVGMYPIEITIEHIPTSLTVRCEAGDGSAPFKSQHKTYAMLKEMLEYGLVTIGYVDEPTESQSHD